MSRMPASLSLHGSKGSIQRLHFEMFKIVSKNCFAVFSDIPVADAFTVEDFEGVCMANTSMALVIPGELGAVEALSESYFIWNLLPEAASALKFRLHCQLLLLRGAQESSVQRLYRVSDTVYKLALCYYRMGSFDSVSKTLRQHLSNKSVALAMGVSALTARMMTLLMCAEYHQDNMDNVCMYSVPCRMTIFVYETCTAKQPL